MSSIIRNMSNVYNRNVYAAWFWMHLLAACVAAGVVDGLGWLRYLDDPCYQ